MIVLIIILIYFSRQKENFIFSGDGDGDHRGGHHGEDGDMYDGDDFGPPYGGGGGHHGGGGGDFGPPYGDFGEEQCMAIYNISAKKYECRDSTTGNPSKKCILKEKKGECQPENQEPENTWCYESEEETCNRNPNCEWVQQYGSEFCNNKCFNYDEEKCVSNGCTWILFDKDNPGQPPMCITDPDYKEENSVNKPNLNSKPTPTPTPTPTPNTTPNSTTSACPDTCGMLKSNDKCDSCLKKHGGD